MSARKEIKTELSVALKDVQKAPHREELWDRLEEVVVAQQKPEEAAELYRKVVRETTRAETIGIIGQRAVKFHEEWFGAQADGLLEIVSRVLEVDPAADWALRR